MRLRPAAASLASTTAACSLVLCIAALVLRAQASTASAAERVSLQRTAALPLSILAFAAVGALVASATRATPLPGYSAALA